ncbi:MAG: hypothetical protein PHT79_03550 [Syntrophomonadaceae bacterium]|nr:hypothetical protein [Syntrophomonadaceae bacterium]
MKNSELKITVIIISLLVVLGTSMLSFHFYQKFILERPLAEKLSDRPEVEDVSINKQKGKYLIEIKVKQVSNLEKEFTEINTMIKSTLQDKEYELKIGDKRNQNLEMVFDNIQIAIYDALDNHKYVWLNEELGRYIEPRGMTYKIFIDDQRLYLQINDGQSYLYTIINRTTDQDIV